MRRVPAEFLDSRGGSSRVGPPRSRTSTSENRTFVVRLKPRDRRVGAATTHENVHGSVGIRENGARSRRAGMDRARRLRDMPRDQRHVPPGALLEITTRCFGEQHLMAPRPEVTAAILGVLGFSLALFPGIHLHGFVILSIH